MHSEIFRVNGVKKNVQKQTKDEDSRRIYKAFEYQMRRGCKNAK